MKRRLRWILAVMGAMALAAACGDGSGSANPTGKGETGGLKVNVHNMEEADVAFVRLTLSALDSKAVPKTIDLERNQADSTTPVGPGQVAQWTYLDEDVPVGLYSITARAYDVLSTDPSFDENTPIFDSVAINVTVQAGQTAQAHIFLRQDIEDPDFNTPYITGVTFDNPPIFEEAVTITVFGAAGSGNLTLHAQGDGSFSGADESGWFKGNNNANDSSGADIDWTPAAATIPGVPEDQTVTVRLTDENGNDTRLRMTVTVDHERGNIEFSLNFNHPPLIGTVTSILNDETESVVEITASYTDQEYPTEDVTYNWDVSDCEAAGFEVEDAGPSNYSTANPGATGVFFGDIAGDGTSHKVTLTLNPSGPLPETPPSCVVEITVTDQGLKDESNVFVAGSDSSRKQNINITVGTVDLDFGTGGTGGAGGAGGAGGVGGSP